MDERERWRQFGRWLRDLRTQRGLSITQLARQAGVAYQTVASLEQGGYRKAGEWVTPNPADETLAKLAAPLGVAIDQFYGQVGRYEDRPRTRQSLRRRTQAPPATDALVWLRGQVERHARELDELRERLDRLERNERTPQHDPGLPPRPGPR